MPRHLTIDQLAPKFQAQIRAQLNGGKPIGLARAEEMGAIKIEVAPAKKRLRQNSKPLNKTEQQFHDYLCGWRRDATFHSQSIALLIGNGCRYTPDEFVFWNGGGGCEAWEVKGFMRDDAAVKIKVAAKLYPQINFHLVTKKKLSDGGGWDIQEILP